MGNHFAYTIKGPQPDATALPIRLSQSPSVRREPKFSGNNLRILYQNPTSLFGHRASTSSINNEELSTPTTHLPPTPPDVEEEEAAAAEENGDGRGCGQLSATEAVRLRSTLATPVKQISPPTPDNTPPRDKSRLRPYLGPQTSMTSTRAESFKTAQENLLSDRNSDSPRLNWSAESNRSLSFSPMHLAHGMHKPSPLAKIPITNGEFTSASLHPKGLSPAILQSLKSLSAAESSQPHSFEQIDATRRDMLDEALPIVSNNQNDGVEPTTGSRKDGVVRGRSLRERLEDSRHVAHSPSVDKFASIIGWSHSVEHSIDDRRRWSGISNTSTVEAYLVEPLHVPKKRNTLRHVSKNGSLRSASSPFPNSNRTSMQSSSDSPHRLVHKKARLSDHNRLSFGSEVSQSISITSNPVPKIEVIKVAVIPQRSSSLQRVMSNCSRRHSLSIVGAPSSFRMPRSSDISYRQQIVSDGAGRDRHYPPQVPTRGSSLSAPTSRNTSRSNSITSEYTRTDRRRAEKDLRSTLDRMETERLASSLRSASIENAASTQIGDDIPLGLHRQHDSGNYPLKVRAHSSASGFEHSAGYLTPGTMAWAALRPPSLLHTPFSQPSPMSASPEISEAKLISLHVHNNHSVQLIEPYGLQVSYALEEAQMMNQGEFSHYETLDSPLRNPRKPPAPPRVQFISATPQDEVQTQTEPISGDHAEPSTPKRPMTRPRTDSFGKSLLRAVSLRNPRNKKADQDLDSNLNPFWRPRPFWDGIDGVSPEKAPTLAIEDQGVVKNSLGLPQQRLVIAGPLDLVRKISERRRNRKVIARQSSYNSLQRLRTGHKLCRMPGFGLQLHLLSIRDLQEKMVEARQRKEEKRREKRREVLRKSIGSNVVATGDSRFPATDFNGNTSE